MTLNDLERRNSRYFVYSNEFARIGANYVEESKDRPTQSATRMQSKESGFNYDLWRFLQRLSRTSAVTRDAFLPATGKRCEIERKLTLFTNSKSPYMTSLFTCVADTPNRRRLRSASSNQLDVPSFRLPTVGSRAFPTAGAKVWNSLPDDVTSAPSLSTFRRHLKTHLFRCCYNTL